jgi:hypothetical protein
MSDLFSVRDVIWQSADETERQTLLKRWQSEQGKPKEEQMRTTQSSTILTRLVESKLSEIQEVEDRAELAKHVAQGALIAQKNEMLRKTFSKLVDADVAHVVGG